MDYELYHDESKENGFWHGILLVPVVSKSILIDYLNNARENLSYTSKISFKKVRKRRGKKFWLAESWIQIGVASLIQKVTTKSGLKHFIFLGEIKNGAKEYELFNKLIQAKFILFRERDAHKKMIGHIDDASQFETTFRMGLKGGLHWLGSSEEPIHIVKMHFDGHKHFGRNLDKIRIVDRLNSLREYCTINEIPDLIDDRESNPNKPESQSFEDCQILQLTDLLVSGFRYVFSGSKGGHHSVLIKPLHSLIDKYSEGIARMNNSRWKQSFCLSQCYLDNGKWVFDTLELQREIEVEQLSLFPGT